MNFALLAICIAAITLNVATAEEFDYAQLGPDTWFLNYPDCGGDMQSGINIKDYRAKFDCDLAPFEFANFDQVLTWFLFRTENRLVLHNANESTTEPALYIGGSDFASPNLFTQIDFHYGFNDFQGSEHTLNGVRFPLEMHINAEDGNGNAVEFAFLFRIDERNNTALDAFIEGVGMLESTEEVTIELNLFSIFPADLTRYFRYEGSLVAPPCTEGTSWSVFNAEIPISSFQMEAFRNLPLLSNFRGVQPLNGRHVYSSWRINECTVTD